MIPEDEEVAVCGVVLAAVLDEFGEVRGIGHGGRAKVVLQPLQSTGADAVDLVDGVGHDVVLPGLAAAGQDDEVDLVGETGLGHLAQVGGRHAVFGLQIRAAHVDHDGDGVLAAAERRDALVAVAGRDGRGRRRGLRGSGGLGRRRGLRRGSGLGRRRQSRAHARQILQQAAARGGGAGGVRAGIAAAVAEELAAEELRPVAVVRGAEHHARVVQRPGRVRGLRRLGRERIARRRDGRGALGAAVHKREEQEHHDRDEHDRPELLRNEGEERQQAECAGGLAGGAALVAVPAAAALGAGGSAALAAAADGPAGIDLAALADVDGARADLLFSAVGLVFHVVVLFSASARSVGQIACQVSSKLYTVPLWTGWPFRMTGEGKPQQFMALGQSWVSRQTAPRFCISRPPLPIWLPRKFAV